MLPYTLRSLPLLGLLGALALGFAGCSGQGAPPPRSAPTVAVQTVHTAPVSLTTELPGRVSAFRVAEVRPQVNGVVLRRLFTEGDLVHEGQQLYQIDPAPYEASLASAQATLAHAKAALTAAEAQVERYRPLVEARAVSRQDYDNAVAALDQDRADVQSGLATVRAAAINLAYTKVYSPISGRSGRSSVTEGALVTANQTASLVTITQLDPVYVDLTQPSATLLRLRRELDSGQIRSVGANKAPVQLQLEDGSRYDAQGMLQFSEVTVDQGTGSVTLRAIFPNHRGLLLPGMFVRATLEEGLRLGAILAPQVGITHSPDGTATALVVGPDERIAQRKLLLDRAIGDQWVVTQGLADGDRVVVSGTQKVQPGMQVKVTTSEEPAAEQTPRAALAAPGAVPAGSPDSPASSLDVARASR